MTTKCPYCASDTAFFNADDPTLHHFRCKKCGREWTVDQRPLPSYKAGELEITYSVVENPEGDREYIDHFESEEAAVAHIRNMNLGDSAQRFFAIEKVYILKAK